MRTYVGTMLLGIMLGSNSAPIWAASEDLVRQERSGLPNELLADCPLHQNNTCTYRNDSIDTSAPTHCVTNPAARCYGASADCLLPLRRVRPIIRGAIVQSIRQRNLTLLFEDETPTVILLIAQAEEPTRQARSFYRFRVDLHEVRTPVRTPHSGPGRPATSCRAFLAAHRVTIPTGATSAAQWTAESDEFTGAVTCRTWERVRFAADPGYRSRWETSLDWLRTRCE